MEFYRYEDAIYKNQIVLITLYLVRETPCGYWISRRRHYNEKDESKWFLGVYDKKRWVSKTSRKRYAYPTKEEAQTSYTFRKIREVEICEARLSKAKIMLNKAQNKQFQ